jgi:hypothetical protein
MPKVSGKTLELRPEQVKEQKGMRKTNIALPETFKEKL